MGHTRKTERDSGETHDLRSRNTAEEKSFFLINTWLHISFVKKFPWMADRLHVFWTAVAALYPALETL